MLTGQCVLQRFFPDFYLNIYCATFQYLFFSFSFFATLCALRKTKGSVNCAFVNPVYGSWSNPEKSEVRDSGELYCFRSRNTHIHNVVWTCFTKRSYFIWGWKGVSVSLNVLWEFSIPGQFQSACKISSLLNGFVVTVHTQRSDKSGKYLFHPQNVSQPLTVTTHLRLVQIGLFFIFYCQRQKGGWHSVFSYVGAGNEGLYLKAQKIKREIVHYIFLGPF